VVLAPKYFACAHVVSVVARAKAGYVPSHGCHDLVCADASRSTINRSSFLSI
jgi:hypothetical protein